MIKKRSVFNYSYSKKYLLTHPWKFIKEFFQNCNHAWRRAIYGWTWEDCWNLDDWLLNILPEMLRHMADYGSAYPGFKNEEVDFSTPEKWDDWLHSMADVLESLQEENWFSQNEYEEEFHKQSELHRSKGNKSITEMNDEDFDTLRELYFARIDELTKERKKLLIDTFSKLGQHLDCLWD